MPPVDNQNFQPQSMPPNPQPLPPGQSGPVRHQEGNAIAVVGFILAFLFPLVGLICSIVGLSKSKRVGGKFHGLALAGVILSIPMIIFQLGFFLAIVFIAAPALQRNVRDTNRLADITALEAQMEVWSANNETSLPATQQDLDDIVDKIGWSHYNLSNSQPKAAVRSTAVPAGIEQAGTVTMFIAMTDESINNTVLPSPDFLHIWLGKECVSKALGGGSWVDGHDITYTDDVIKSSIAPQAVAYVYQREIDEYASCRDNT